MTKEEEEKEGGRKRGKRRKRRLGNGTGKGRLFLGLIIIPNCSLEDH